MNKHWIISLVLTAVVLGIGITGFFMIKGTIPGQLDQPSSILLENNASIEEDKAGETALKDIIQEAQTKVVKIELADGSIGSGFLYNDMGDVITNAHVVHGVKEVTIVTSDEQQFTGTVIGISSDIDIALVRVEGLQGLEPLSIRMDKVEVGEDVLALGNPLGLDNTVTTGIISGVGRDFELPPYTYSDAYQISAPIAPGNSGGPLLLSETGEVIGINSAASEVGTIGFSIPIIDVLSLIKGWSASPMTTLPGVE
ncbi:trypsin-like peptidase domain-containing protein [Ornithinibacillus sp. BX22]|uniref:Trypsin-like peptidase domain-containing protein n=2 Tax=Ornithinibacillus TaxID=484508 RepID=A0A923L7T7_9BACI|nr:MULTISPECIES: trypsin-like peptidase domain-containing protein [Ornithinibacillus]MBC5638142.1 trypsin-like peptidase domain-containing protein [Ornithinibacillus hominis]MBS3680786.1 trypsin-like peptidase domain-containing protein [Ornithinibacillus massiliensis]